MRIAMDWFSGVKGWLKMDGERREIIGIESQVAVGSNLMFGHSQRSSGPFFSGHWPHRLTELLCLSLSSFGSSLDLLEMKSYHLCHFGSFNFLHFISLFLDVFFWSSYFFFWKFSISFFMNQQITFFGSKKFRKNLQSVTKFKEEESQFRGKKNFMVNSRQSII